MEYGEEESRPLLLSTLHEIACGEEGGVGGWRVHRMGSQFLSEMSFQRHVSSLN